jgi:hypothetical protein
MTDKQLIAKLNNLKKLSPDSAWLSSNRELLLSQISNSGAENLSFWKTLEINLASAFQTAAQPAYALAAFVLVLLVGSLVSAEFFAGTKPNDSLYIARIISEQVKLNTTFSAVARDRLAGQFAAGHAQDITAVLADPKFNTEANKDEVAALSDSFNKEVDTVKDKITRLAASGKNKVDGAAEILTIADSAKDQNGIQLLEDAKVTANLPVGSGQPVGQVQSGQGQPSAEIVATPAAGVSWNATATLPAGSAGAGILNLNASSTFPAGATTSVTTESGASEGSSAAAIKILDEAKQLFGAKDYNKASDKLKEIDEIIK